MRTIVFYATLMPDSANLAGLPALARVYRRAEKLIKDGGSFGTNQMSFLDHPLSRDYDELVIRDYRRVITIANNHDGTWRCDATDRTLRDGNSFFHLWQAGEFNE